MPETPLQMAQRRMKAVLKESQEARRFRLTLDGLDEMTERQLSLFDTHAVRTEHSLSAMPK